MNALNVGWCVSLGPFARQILPVWGAVGCSKIGLCRLVLMVDLGRIVVYIVTGLIVPTVLFVLCVNIFVFKAFKTSVLSRLYCFLLISSFLSITAPYLDTMSAFCISSLDRSCSTLSVKSVGYQAL